MGFTMRLTKCIILSLSMSVLAACVEHSAEAPTTDCIKVARWVELGLQAESLISDESQDAAYNQTIADRQALGRSMSEHDTRFGETLVNQINTRAAAPYADIYGLCRKWETGNY